MQERPFPCIHGPFSSLNGSTPPPSPPRHIMYFANNFTNFYNSFILVTQRVTMDPRFNTAIEFGRFADDLAQILPSILSAFS